MLKNDQTYCQKSCSVNTARFLKYIWSFINIMKEMVNLISRQKFSSNDFRVQIISMASVYQICLLIQINV